MKKCELCGIRRVVNRDGLCHECQQGEWEKEDASLLANEGRDSSGSTRQGDA